MLHTHFDTEVVASNKLVSHTGFSMGRPGLAGRRAAWAEARVEIALSHKHPPGDPIKATHQRGCLSHMSTRGVFALLVKPIKRKTWTAQQKGDGLEFNLWVFLPARRSTAGRS